MAESILIIGGGSDIAQQLAHKLTQNGYLVTMLVRNNESLDGHISSRVTVVNGDALSSEDLTSAIEMAKQQGDGEISGMAHLVGSVLIRPPHAVKVEAFEEVIQTNLVSAFMALSILGYISYKNQKLNFLFIYLLLISVFLEILHIIIPNRGFEFTDLFGNILGGFTG